MNRIIIYIISFIVISGCSPKSGSEKIEFKNSNTAGSSGLKSAIFAGGCFWCVESDFEKLPGVKNVISGYTGGNGDTADYESYSSKGYVEAVQVFYDPGKITYNQLTDYFWKHVDPTDSGGQFVDRGIQYRSEIYYQNDEQKKIAEKSKSALIESKIFNKPVITRIVKFKNFIPAEDYHQDYYKKNPLRYSYYRNGSGRDSYLRQIWGSGQNKINPDAEQKYTRPEDTMIKEKLTPLQYKVTQEDGTEPPFNNEYWDNHKEGIYVDIVSGEPLFSSVDKFESGTGWPSFTKPLEPEFVVERTDNKLFMKRTEVRSRNGNSHLGHVFPDGPAPTGLRYCMNSAAMRFISKDELEKQGYGKYLKLFK